MSSNSSNDSNKLTTSNQHLHGSLLWQAQSVPPGWSPSVKRASLSETPSKSYQARTMRKLSQSQRSDRSS